MKLIDMHHKPGEGEAIPTPDCPGEYPYGLRITLNEEQLEALGIEMPKAGTALHIEAKAIVTRASTEDPDADGDIDYVCVELQLTELGVEVEENAVETRNKKAKKLYA
jgi:hypothetical protein